MYGRKLMVDDLGIQAGICTIHIQDSKNVLQPLVDCFGTRNTLDSRDRSLQLFQSTSGKFDMLQLLTLRKLLRIISLQSLLKSCRTRLVQTLLKMTGFIVRDHKTQGNFY